MQKKVSAAAFRLKGGGWYETDFKSGDKKNVAGDAQTDKKPNKKVDKNTGESKKSTSKKPSGDSTKNKKIKNSSL